MINPIKWWRYKPHSKRLAIQLLLVLIGLTAALDWHFYQPLRTEMVYADVSVNYEPPVMSFEEMPQNIKDTIDYFCDTFGVDKNTVHKLINCESSGDPTRTGDYQMPTTSRGLFQFQLATFAQYAATYKVKNADINDWRDQALIAIQMIRDGKISAWTCSRLIK